VDFIFNEIRFTDRGKCCKEIRCARELCEARLELLPISFGKASDQIFFGGEVNIQGAGRDARLTADVLHAGGMKARLREPTLGGVKDMIAAGALGIGFQPGHMSSSLDKQNCLLGLQRTLKQIVRKTNVRFFWIIENGVSASRRTNVRFVYIFAVRRSGVVVVVAELMHPQLRGTHCSYSLETGGRGLVAFGVYGRFNACRGSR
jgi:hypothetical protein